jgi:hypothetical protein
MKSFRFLAAAALFGVFLLAAPASRANAQVNIAVNIGPAPVCPYGYFNYSPYNCAPFGYYGPEWFQSGIFIGAGPWFAGPVGFRGYYNRRFDPHYGYRGALPPRGMHPDWDRHRGWEQQFHGSGYRTEYRHDNGNHNGQYKDHGNPHEDDHGHGNPHGDDHGHGHDDHGHGH